MYYKAKSAIKLKPDPMILVIGDLILLSNLPKPWAIGWRQENRPFLLVYSTYRIITRTESFTCSSVRLYYFAQNNVVK